MKHLLFLFLLLLLVAPALQAKFHWFEEIPLLGAYNMAQEPQLSANAILAGEYQPGLENYLQDRIGFRSSLVRLRNQLSFSLFGVARSSELVIGKDNVLYQPGPVNSYLGKDFLGEDEIRYRIRRMRIVQQELTKRGIPFLFIMAPNKARYQSKDLPVQIQKTKQAHSNYDVFMQQMKLEGINVLDFNQLFRQWKDTARFPLFPKGGTHWSAYGSTLAADTMFKHIEKVGAFDLINFRVEGKTTTSPNDVRGTDSDLSDPMNLLSSYQHYPMAYPRIVFDSLQPGQQRPSILVSGDSFGAALMQFNPYFQTLFSPDSRYWGVEETIFLFSDNSAVTGESVAQLDLHQQFESRKLIMILVTEHNLIYDGFVNHLYELYHPLTDKENARIKEIGQALVRQPDVADSIWAQANKENRSYEAVLYDRARSVYDHTER